MGANSDDLTPREAAPVRRSPLAVRVLAAALIGALFYFAHTAFVPVVMAILFTLILSPPVEALHRYGLPRSLAAVVVLLILAVAAGFAVDLLRVPAQTWWATAPQTIRTIERKLRPASALVGKIEMLTDSAGQMAQLPAAPPPAKPSAATQEASSSSPPASRPAPPAAAAPSNVALYVFTEMHSVLVSAVAVIIVTLFGLAGGPPMLARMTAALARDLNSSHTLRVIDAVRGEISRYYVTIALINVGLGLATAAVTMLLGMPNPLLWGAVAAVLNFVPYVGPAITLVLLTVVAFVTFDSIGHVLAVAGSFLAISTVEGQIVQPLFIGHRLELNPIIVFLALWFWGWFWGIPGIIIAVPSLIALKVVAEHSKDGKPLEEFLGRYAGPRLRPARMAKSLHLKRMRAMRRSKGQSTRS
jgi:predicted PurR-regulated permease PerM